MDGVAAIALTASMVLVLFFGVNCAISARISHVCRSLHGWLAGKRDIRSDRCHGRGPDIRNWINLLGIGKIKIGNFLPALLIVAILAWW